MFCFMKRPIRLSCNLPKMQEVDASTEFVSHGQQVVICPCAERPDTKRQPVFRHIGGSKNRPHVLGGRNHSRKAEQRPGWVVGVNCKPNSDLLCDRDNLT